MSTEPTIDELFHGAEEVVEAVTEAFEQLPRDFKRQWEVFEGLEPGRLADMVRRDFEHEPDTRREILIAYLAQQLGYRRYLNRQSALTEDPLWDLIHPKKFNALQPGDRQLLWMVAGSTRQIRSYLEPRAALAAIALWRLDGGDLGARADALLRQKTLPNSERWLYDLIRELAGKRAEDEVEAGRKIFDLAKLQHEAGFHDSAALFCALYLTRLYDPWYTGTAQTNMLNACDTAAESEPWRNRKWIDLMADAAIAGQLTHAWLEKPMSAAIRMALDSPARDAKLRQFHGRNPYDVSSARLESIYQTRLKSLSQGDARHGAWLFAEVEAAAKHNPRRAMHLLELVVGYSHQGVGSSGAQLVQVLEGAAELDPLLERLATLYVRCFALERHAIRFVERHRARINWEHYTDVDPADVDVYISVADYEHGFFGRKVSYAGVDIDHNDKDAAAHVRYFRAKRTNPNTVTGVISNLNVPDEWLAGNIGESQAVNRLFEEMMAAFEANASGKDQSEYIKNQYAIYGQPLDDLSQMITLPTPKIERMMKRNRHKPLLMSAAVGAVSGAFAPSTLGLSAVIDAPLVMGLVTKTCADMCWYYGFDPEADPQLPITILAIALDGSQPKSLDPKVVHQKFHAFLVRKSVIIAAIAQGAGGHILGSTLMSFLDTYRSSRRSFQLSGARVLRWLNREEDSWRSRALERANELALPAFESLLGAALNVALLYDVCESAEAVLTDRFLAAKYPDRKRTW